MNQFDQTTIIVSNLADLKCPQSFAEGRNSTRLSLEILARSDIETLRTFVNFAQSEAAPHATDCICPYNIMRCSCYWRSLYCLLPGTQINNPVQQVKAEGNWPLEE